MKTAAISLVAISLIQLAASQPHRRHLHQHQDKKRDVVTVVQTVVAVATAVPEVIIYVDQNGKPVSTMTNGVLAGTTSPITVSLPVTPTSAPVAAAVANVGDVTSLTSSLSAVPTTTTGKDSTTPGTTYSGGSGYGYSYSPYNSDGSCKTAAQVDLDISKFDKGISLVRTYGTDCGTIGTVYPAVQKYKLKLFAGIFSLSDIAGQVKLIVDGVNGDWSCIDTISVGNELVDSGQADAGTVLAAMQSAKTLLQAAKYTGPVVTVDTLQANLKYPELCDRSDYCAVNCHPFFDPNTQASGAGAFLTSSIATLKTKLSNPSQKIVITETGWPSDGSPNSMAVPSQANQQAAISSIKSTFAGDPASVILLSAYNTLWKKSSPAQFGAEPWWGIQGSCPSG